MKGGGTYHHRIVRGLAAEDAQATAEYAVILVFVTLAGIAGYELFGGTVVGLYNSFVSAFKS